MTDLNEIELSPEQKKIIAERAAQNGKPWQTVLQDAITPKSEEEKYDLDTDFLALCEQELEALNQELGPEPVTHERMREILSKVPGSMSDDILEDRGDR